MLSASQPTCFLIADISGYTGYLADVELDHAQDILADLIDTLLTEATRAPELWNQKSYLARTVLTDASRGIIDDGILPLQLFVDSQGPDGVAVAVEANPAGELYPAVYVRKDNAITEHLLPTNPLLDFETAEHRKQLADALRPLGL